MRRFGFAPAARGDARPVRFFEMLARWMRGGAETPAAKQEADPHALDRQGDPRGGVQSEDYRTADPRDVVQEGDVVMGAPGGAPQEGTSVEQRRAESNEAREASQRDDPTRDLGTS